jgi:TRAP-type uncharacterized transport system substrate-binding protein
VYTKGVAPVRKIIARVLASDWLVWLGVLAALGLVVATVLWLQPRQLSVAAAQGDVQSQRIVQALADSLSRERGGVRIVPIWTTSSSESVRMFNQGQTDLVVARSDAVLATGSTSIMSLRRFFPVVITRKASKISKVSELRGKKIGVGGQSEQNPMLLRQLLAHWGLQEADFTIVPVQRGEQLELATSGKIDAFFAVSSGRIRSGQGSADTLRKAWGRDFVVLAFDDADALALSIRGVESGELVKGFFGGEPAKPEEDTESATVSTRLIASEKVTVQEAVALSRALLSLRDKRQAEVPEVLGIEAPSREVPTLPVHSGTAQLLDGVYQDFLDRYTNHIFMAVALLGAAGSSLTTLKSRRRRQLRERAVLDLHYLLSLSDQIALQQADPKKGALLLQEVDGIFQRSMLACAQGDISSGTLAAIQAAVSRCHRAAQLRDAFA